MKMSDHLCRESVGAVSFGGSFEAFTGLLDVLADAFGGVACHQYDKQRGEREGEERFDDEFHEVVADRRRVMSWDEPRRKSHPAG
jgi:hypothetical protein